MVGNPFYLVYVRKSRTFSCFELELELEQKPRTFRTRTSNSNAFDPTLQPAMKSERRGRKVFGSLEKRAARRPGGHRLQTRPRGFRPDPNPRSGNESLGYH